MKRIVVIFLAILLLAGCAGFLDEQNKSSISNADLYETAVGYETLMTASYTSLRNIYRITPWLLLAGTDLYEKSFLTADVNIAVYSYYTLFANNVNVTSFYTNCYSGIQTVNVGLYYNSLPKDMDENVRETYKSELRFLRAFYHFLLVEQFGGVAINQEMTLTPRTNMPRNTLEECYDFIISEMEDCINGLGQSTVARVNRDVVNHYLAKVYLTRGWDLNQPDDFTKAKQYAQKVFDSRGEIALTYEDLWSWLNENNSEILFAVQFDSKSITTYNVGNNQQNVFCPSLGDGSIFSKGGLRELMVGWNTQMWYAENDARYDATFMLTFYERYFDYYTVEDKSTLKVRAFFPRVWGRDYTQEELDDWLDTHEVVGGSWTFRFVPFIEDEERYRDENHNWSLPPMKKFDSPASSEYVGISNVSVRDIVLARLGETYFLYAEACIGLNDFATAATYVQKVLDRPGNAKFGRLANALDGATTREEALHGYLIESGKEFLGEYNGRWPELRRTGMLKFMTERYNYDIRELVGLGTSIDFNKYKLRPIPEDAILLNDGMSREDQNPGY